MIRPRHIAVVLLAVVGFAVALACIAHPWVSVAGMAACVGACVWGVVCECWEGR